MDGIWFVYLILAAFPGLILFAAIYKYFEVRRASTWPSAPGRVVVSNTQAREVKSGGTNSDDTEVRNFANVIYEYKVATRTYRCDRVSIGENLGNFEVAETLAKYPVGKAVTVYYNPNKRDEAVLERDVPAFLWKGVAVIVLVLAAVILGGIFGLKGLGQFLAGAIHNTAEAPFVTACIGFSLVFALVLLGIQRAGARARSWPVAPGRVEFSGVHSFETRDTDSDSQRVRTQTMYRADVRYTYEVAGVHYTGDKVPSNGMSANFESLAHKNAARYPIGAVLDVHYNPDNPGDSTVDPGSSMILWLFWLVPAGLLTLAWFVAR